DDGQPAAGGKPQLAVGRAFAASAGGNAGRALSAAQPVLHAVVRGGETANFMRVELFQLALRNAADAARRRQPERAAAVVFDMSDIVAEQPVARGVSIKSAAAECVQAATERADPECAVRIL